MVSIFKKCKISLLFFSLSLHLKDCCIGRKSKQILSRQMKLTLIYPETWGTESISYSRINTKADATNYCLNH